MNPEFASGALRLVIQPSCQAHRCMHSVVLRAIRTPAAKKGQRGEHANECALEARSALQVQRHAIDAALNARELREAGLAGKARARHNNLAKHGALQDDQRARQRHNAVQRREVGDGARRASPQTGCPPCSRTRQASPLRPRRDTAAARVVRRAGGLRHTAHSSRSTHVSRPVRGFLSSHEVYAAKRSYWHTPVVHQNARSGQQAAPGAPRPHTHRTRSYSQGNRWPYPPRRSCPSQWRRSAGPSCPQSSPCRTTAPSRFLLLSLIASELP